MNYKGKRRRVLSCGAAIFASFLLGLAPAPAVEQPGGDFVDAAPEVQKLLSNVSNWSDYTCYSELHNFKPDKTTISASRFFYKKGPVVRIEVVGGGFRNGSVVVRSFDGKISARGGGLMSAMQMTLDPDSRMLILPSGVNVMHADFPELFAKLKDDIAHGYTVKISASPVNDTEMGRKVLYLEIHDSSNALKARVFLSAEDHLPLRWDSFRADGGKTQTFFKNLKFNAGLSDDLFKM